MVHQFNGAAAIRGAMMVMGSTYVTYGIGLLTSILVARTLGPESFGRYTYIIWLAGMVVAFGNHGLTTTAIRFVSENLGRGDPDASRAVHGSLQRLQLLSLAGVVVLFFVGLPFLKPAGWEGSITVFVTVALLGGSAKALYLFDVSVAKGYGRFGLEAKATVSLSVINLLMVLLLLWMRAPLAGYLMLFLGISIGYVVASRWMLHRGGVRTSDVALSPELRSRLRRHLGWTMVLAMAVALSARSIQTWMLNAVVGSAEVGYFAIAAALTRGGVELLASGLGTVLMPMMAHAFGEGGLDRVGAIMSNSVRYFVFIGLLLAGGGALVADTAVGLLYGPEYAPVVNALRVMRVVGGVTLAQGAFNALLSTTDNQRLRVGYVFVSIGITAVASVALIPKYGLNGALASIVVAELTVFALLSIGVTRALRLTWPWRELSRMVLCALVAITVACMPMLMIGVNIWTELAAALIYASVFVSGTLLLRAWRADDVHAVGSFLSRYPAIWVRVQGALQRWAARLPADTVRS